jgi:outer membrane receptor protein involved in Fe transport
VGAYALRLRESGNDLSTGTYVDPFDAGNDGSDDDHLDLHYRATNLALFGQLDGRLAPRWRWSAGLRLEQRRARYHDEKVSSGDLESSPQLGARDRMVGGQLSLTRELSTSTSLYATVSRGYKAGGFNLGDIDAAHRDFMPEYLWNLETGMKADLGARGHGEVSLFYERRHDQQVRTGVQLTPGDPNTYQFITTNLPHGYGAGVEASLQYQLLRGLEVGASLGLLRTRSGTFTMLDEDGNEVIVPSRENAHAPSYNAALNATWRGGGGFMARADFTAMDAFYFDVPTDHDRRSKAYQLVNLKAGYEQGSWAVYGWVRNAFDRDYAVRGFFFANEPPDWADKLYVQKGDPRQVGITATLRF